MKSITKITKIEKKGTGKKYRIINNEMSNEKKEEEIKGGKIIKSIVKTEEFDLDENKSKDDKKKKKKQKKEKEEEDIEELYIEDILTNKKKDNKEENDYKKLNKDKPKKIIKKKEDDKKIIKKEEDDNEDKFKFKFNKEKPIHDTKTKRDIAISTALKRGLENDLKNNTKRFYIKGDKKILVKGVKEDEVPDIDKMVKNILKKIKEEKRPILNKKTNRPISYKTALKLGFEIKIYNEDFEIINKEDKKNKDKQELKLFSVKEVEQKLNNGEIDHLNIINKDYVYELYKNGYFEDPKQRQMKKKKINLYPEPSITKQDELKIIKHKEDKDFIRYELTKTDKNNPMLIYDFFKIHNLKVNVKGSLILLQGGFIIELKKIDIDKLSRWWKDGAWTIGLIDSESHIWNSKHTFNPKDKINKVETKKFNYLTNVNNGVKLEYYNSSKADFLKYRITANENEKMIDKTKSVLYFFPDTKVKPMKQKIIQYYKLDDVNLCFFKPILKICNDKIKNKQSMKTMPALKNKLEVEMKNYKNGVSNDDIKILCDKFKINVNIYDIFNNKYKYYKCSSSSILTMNYLNTCFNHLDKNIFIDNKNNIEEVKFENVMNDVINDLIKNKKWFYYVGSRKEPNMIYTEEKTYKFINENNIIINKFLEDNNFHKFSLNYFDEKDKKIIDYIRDNGVNYASHCKLKKNEEELKNLIHNEDVKKYYEKINEKKEKINEYKRKLNISYNQDEKDELEYDIYIIEKDIKEYEDKIEEKKKKIKRVIKDIGKEYFEPDMKKAYTQYKKCKYYLKMPTILTEPRPLKNWTIKKIKKYVGYYTVKILSFDNKNTKDIFDDLGLEENNEYTFTSPELLLFNDYGVKFKVIYGSYSFNTFDFDFTKEVIENKRYAKLVGKYNSFNTKKVFKTYTSDEMINFISQNYKDVYINSYDVSDTNLKCCSIELDAKKTSYLGHIGGYITAYCRCNVLNEMLKIEHKNLLGLKLDGFITKKKCKFDNPEIWAYKNVKTSFGWASNIFDVLNEDNMKEINNEIKNYNFENDIYKEHQYNLLCGPGGSGKTYITLKNNKDCLYISSMWRLNCEKQKEFDVKGLSIHQLIGENCEGYLTRHKYPLKVLIDEINMIDKSWIERAMKLMPYTQFFLCGDLEYSKNEINFYQCNLKDCEIFNKVKDFNIINFTKNYRCKDEVLNKRLINLRKFMKDSNFNNKEIIKYTIENFKDRFIKEEKLKNNYNYKKDWVLVSTTNETEKNKMPQTKYYNQLLDGEKYKCVRHTKEDIYKKLDGYDAYLNGDIIIDLNEDDKKLKRFEKQNAFTIHSFQGLTIKDPEKLYIDLNNIFCARQIYTALSRVQKLEQIFIIDNIKKGDK